MSYPTDGQSLNGRFVPHQPCNTSRAPWKTLPPLTPDQQAARKLEDAARAERMEQLFLQPRKRASDQTVRDWEWQESRKAERRKELGI